MWHALAANCFWLGVLEARVAIRVRTAMRETAEECEAATHSLMGGYLILGVYWPAVSGISYRLMPGI